MMRILHLADIETILNFERQKLLAQEAGEALEREMAEWHAPWRREALEHYLSLGWSFGDFQDDVLNGYFLAQPMLFVGAMTQSLWVEYLSANTSALTVELLDVAYRTCREKHFQRLVLRTEAEQTFEGSGLRMEVLGDRLLEIKTAKF